MLGVTVVIVIDLLSINKTMEKFETLVIGSARDLFSRPPGLLLLEMVVVRG
jgi:hypothetical protein